MKIATWNVNSLKVRLPHVIEFLAAHEPDVLVLQETKQVTEVFPHAEIAAAGYRAIASGQKTYNGVAVISKDEALAPVTDFPGYEDPQRRILATTINGVRVVNLYIPNGAEVGAEKYAYKLSWLAALRTFLDAEIQAHDKLVVLGDFNIAPADEDVYDAQKWGEGILCSPAERKALQALLDLGLSDVFRQFQQAQKSFSWWDYRHAGFDRNAGLRIDLVLATESLSKNCTASYVDKEPRGWERPSDHAPVLAEFDI